ncbi:MAG TPA: phage holin family protein [Mycobacteriales bacterium]|nr:phage holin family protein [Mycobacteriales bacterium]
MGGRLIREGRLLLRILVVWIITAAAALLLAQYLPGFKIPNIANALAAAAAVAGLNALVWPFFMRLALGSIVLTLGLGVFIIDGALVYIVMDAVPGVTISGLIVPFTIGPVLTAVTAFASGLMALDDDHFYQRFIVGRAARKGRTIEAGMAPGVLFLQIDGLGYDVARRAVRDGDAPELARWLMTGSHSLRPWHTDWPSQTGASQAGILHGDNHDMPAFRWYEKDTGRLEVCNRAGSAARIEREHSDGRGLLHADGASRGNLFTGDAEHVSLTMSAAARKKGKLGAGYYGYFANPYNAARTLFAFFAEIVREIWQATAQRRRGVWPRVHRGGLYPALRALSTVVARDVTVQAVLEDIMAGRAVVYADFTGYDEVAHHSGIERYDALGVLRGIDRQIGRLAAAAAKSPRPYRIVVLSDHGQSQGPAFEDRYGHRLEDLVNQACGLPVMQRRRSQPGSEARARAETRLQAAASGEGPVARALRRTTHAELIGGEAVLGETATRTAATQIADRSPLLTLASGNLGLVYLTDVPGRAPLEEIRRRYPELLPRLVDHPGIGFVLVRSIEHGPIALGHGGTHRLRDGVISGQDPLAAFGPLAPARLLRIDSFGHTADLMINSAYEGQTDQVHSFEPFVGSHGGMGGPQSEGFVLFPHELPYPDEPVVGAERVHRIFRGWLAALGHEAFTEPAASDHASR